MNHSVRSVLRQSWPVLGSLYLVYLALQPPPSRYVGLGGLVIVTPLLLGWAVGHLVGIGPWTPAPADAGGGLGGSDGTGSDAIGKDDTRTIATETDEDVSTLDSSG